MKTGNNPGRFYLITIQDQNYYNANTDGGASGCSAKEIERDHAR